MKTFTKEELISELEAICNRGWFTSTRGKNDGALGNTLEDLLGIEENNLPIPNASEWELKTKRIGTSSLTSLVHPEPSPRALKMVPQILLPRYGWPHKGAGTTHPKSELSLRMTLTNETRTDRGFNFVVDRKSKRIVVTFDAASVDKRHKEWLKTVKARTGLGDIDPNPYWGFDDLAAIIRAKLTNAFYVEAERRRNSKGLEEFLFKRVTIVSNFTFSGFLKLAEKGILKIDFDARTGHNHGTKFRIKSNYLPDLYENTQVVIDRD